MRQQTQREARIQAFHDFHMDAAPITRIPGVLIPALRARCIVSMCIGDVFTENPAAHRRANEMHRVVSIHIYERSKTK